MAKQTKLTKKQIQEQAITNLLDQIETARAWFEDTSYPKQSRIEFEKAVTEFKAAFDVI